MSDHKALSASQTKWWASCAGALAYLEKHPVPDKSSEYADLGTAAHILVEVCLRDGYEPTDLLGERIYEKGSGKEYEVNQDMVEAVECMTTYVRRRVKELGVTMACVRLETKVNPLPDRDDTGGTADVIIDAWPEVLEVVDYKHGSGVFVPVEGNMQLRSYALGALREAGGGDYEEVRYTICQPRHTQAPADGIMSEATTPEDLMHWGAHLSEKADRVDDARERINKYEYGLSDLYGDQFISAGEDGSHCTFCPLKVNCPAMAEKAQETARIDFMDDPEPLNSMPKDGHAFEDVLKWIPVVRKWFDAVVAEAESTLLTGGEIPGYKLVRGRSVRKWNPEVSEKDLHANLAEDYGFKLEELYTEQAPKLITGPQAEKLIPKAQRKEFNQKYLVKTEAPLTMVPESDKRAAVVVNPADDFEDDLEE